MAVFAMSLGDQQGSLLPNLGLTAAVILPGWPVLSALQASSPTPPLPIAVSMVHKHSSSSQWPPLRRYAVGPFGLDLQPGTFFIDICSSKADRFVG